MITRIELTNFMSHEHTVIEPAAGLTVLIGRNNVGKSAIVAALQLLCENGRAANYAIRHGAKSCSVTLKTDDGHEVTWTRNKTASHYVIDGVKFDRLRASGCPEELHQVLRLGKVDGNEQFDVHFGAQKSPIFLLDKPSSAAAQFFASSSDAIRLVEMQQLHKDRVRQAKSDKKRLEEEAQLLNSQLLALEPTVRLEARITQLEKDYQGWLAGCDRAEEFREIVADFERQSLVSGQLSEQVNVLHLLQSPPQLEDLDQMKEVILEIDVCQNQLQQLEAEQDVLKHLERPPLLSDTLNLQRVTESLQSVQKELHQLGQHADCLEQLSSPPQLNETSQLARLLPAVGDLEFKVDREARCLQLLDKVAPLMVQDCRDLERIVFNLAKEDAHVRQLELTFQHFNRMTSVPPMEQGEQLTDVIRRMAIAAEEVARLEEMNRQHNSELEGVDQEIHDLAREQPCPVCGGTIDPEQAKRRAIHAGGT